MKKQQKIFELYNSDSLRTLKRFETKIKKIEEIQEMPVSFEEIDGDEKLDTAKILELIKSVNSSL